MSGTKREQGGAILPEPIGEDGFVQPKEGDANRPEEPGGQKPEGGRGPDFTRERRSS